MTDLSSPTITGSGNGLSAHLAAIVEFSDDAILSRDLNGTIRSWNKSAERIFGYQAQEIVGDSINRIVPQNLLDEEQKINESIIKGIPIKQLETVRRRKDGNNIVVSLTVSPIRDEDGNIVGASKIARDITNEKEFEYELRESQAILALTMRSSRMGAWSREIATGKMWWSEEIEEIAGYPRGSFGATEDGFFEYILKSDGNEVRSKVATAIQEKREYCVEFRFRHGDGTIHWMEGRGQAVYTDKGEAIRTYGIGIDITERKKTENRAAGEYLELLSRIVPLAQKFGTARNLLTVYRAVREFVCQSMSCSAFIVSLYDEVNHLRIAEYVWGVDREVPADILPPLPISDANGANAEAILQKKTVTVDHQYTDSLRNRPHVILQDTLPDPNSSLIVPMLIYDRVIGTIEVQAIEDRAFRREHILTMEMVANLAAVAVENVRLIKDLDSARHEAESANIAKDNFLSVLSHELRTPLNSMLGWTQILKSGTPDKEKTAHAVSVIERNVHLQNSLIEDLLDVSRIISGKMRIEKSPTNFAAVVAGAVDIARPSAVQKKIELSLTGETANLIVSGDELRLQQIVANLINNAVKFTPGGGKVSLDLKKSGDTVQLIVADTGFGIEPDLLPKIFDRFLQADSTTKRTHSGLGLGLTIVRHLTDLHEGKISAASEGQNKGATFTMELPLIGGSAERSVDEDSFAPENILRGVRILLVDDDVEAMLPLEILLENEEAEVTSVSSAQEALDELSRRKYDLLVSDIGMPHVDGYDLIARLRETEDSPNRSIPAVALTAYASAQDRQRALESGFVHHFGKPLDFDNFLTALKSTVKAALKS